MPVLEGFAYNPGMRGLRQEDDESGQKYTARPCLRGKKIEHFVGREGEPHFLWVGIQDGERASFAKNSR